MVFTTRWPPWSTTASTLPATRLDTKSVPLSPHVIARALLIPLAHSSTLNPCGPLILPTGISAAGFGAGGCATGDSGELAIAGGWPCFHDGGGCWARANGATVRTA